MVSVLLMAAMLAGSPKQPAPQPDCKTACKQSVAQCRLGCEQQGQPAKMCSDMCKGFVSNCEDNCNTAAEMKKAKGGKQKPHH